MNAVAKTTMVCCTMTTQWVEALENISLAGAAEAGRI
jgi:hypothetical protein